MDDLRSPRPERSAGLERYTPQSKNSSDKPAAKKTERLRQKSVNAEDVPVVAEIDEEQDHQLDERA